MTRTPLLCLTLVLTSCVGRQAFYVSPHNGINQPYHNIPLSTDSVRTASYLSGSLAFGDANDRGKDSKFAFRTAFSQGTNFGIFQARYGLGLTAGNYRVQKFDSVDLNQSVDPGYLNPRAGNYFFGGAGAEGAVNVVASLPRGEWRVLGVEASLQREFGKFRDFRRQMPDSVATQVVRAPWYGALGVTTEFVFGTPRNNGGFRLAYGWTVGNGYRDFSGRDRAFIPRSLSYNYFNLGGQITNNRVTYFFQGNFAEKAHSFLFGVNYRLTR